VRTDSLQQLASIAWFSDDPRTQNAAVVVDTETHFRYGIALNSVTYHTEDEDERVKTGLKATYVEHAERAAIYRAAKEGWSCDGCEMHALWAACPDCARAIISSGITAVHTCEATYAATPERWRLTVRRGLAMLEEAGVEVVFHRNIGISILFNGEELDL